MVPPYLQRARAALAAHTADRGADTPDAETPLPEVATTDSDGDAGPAPGATVQPVAAPPPSARVNHGYTLQAGRDSILFLAQYAGWPTLRLSQRWTIGGDKAAWQAFVRQSSPADVELARTQLEVGMSHGDWEPSAPAARATKATKATKGRRRAPTAKRSPSDTVP
jgi:hypothetical protein